MAEINLRSYDFQVCDGKLVFCDGKCDNCTVDEMIDLVEVVRCKDCKYYLNSNEKCGLVDTRLLFYETDKVWTEDCFCAWGERNDEID